MEANLQPTETPIVEQEVLAPEELGVNTDPFAGDGLSSGLGDPLSVEDMAPLFPVGQSQLEGASEIYRAAMLDNEITPQSVANMLDASLNTYDVQTYLQSIEKEDSEAKKEAILNTLTNPKLSVDAKLALTEALHTEERSIDPIAIQRQAMLNIGYAEAGEDDSEDAAAQEERVGEEALSVVSPTSEAPPQDVYAELDAMYNTAQEEMGWNAGTAIDFVEQITPIGSLPTLNAVVQRIWNEAGMGEDGLSTDDAGTYVAVGTRMRQLRDEYKKGNEMRKRQLAEIVLKNLKANSGIIQDSNDLVTMQVLDTILFEQPDAFTQGLQKVAQAGTGYAPALSGIAPVALTAPLLAGMQPLQLQEGIDNAFNMLDVVAVGGLVKTSIKGAFRFLSKPAQWLKKVAPETSLRRGVAATENAEEAARQNTTPELSAENFLPKTTDADDTTGLNGMMYVTERELDARDALLRQSAKVNLTAQERAAALEELRNEVGAIVSKPLPKAHVNETVVVPREDGNGATVSAIFGKDAARGWATLRGAQKAKLDAVEELFGVEAPVEIVQKNAKGQWEAVAGDLSPSAKGEFFLRAVDERQYDSARKTFGAITLDVDAVDELALGVGISKWTRGMNVLGKFDYNTISSRVRGSRAIDSTFTGALKDVAKLKLDDKMQLNRVIVKNEGKTLSIAQLQKEGLSEAAIEGYYKFRHVDDTLYELADRQLRTLYQREGMKDVQYAGQRVGFAKPVNALNSTQLGNVRVFDPVAGAYSRLTQADVDKLYKSGGQLARLRHPISGASGEATHVLLGAKSGVRILPVPTRGVLPRIEGHYPHIFQGNYVVEGIKADGSRVALKMARSMVDANDFVTRQTARVARRASKGRSTKFAKYVVNNDRSLNNIDAWAAKLDEVAENLGGPIFGQRSGGKLGNLSPQYGDIQTDPIASLLAGTRIVSQSVTKRNLTGTMRQRLLNYLKNEGMLIDPKTTAQGLSKASIRTDRASRDAVNKALAYWNRIELTEHTADAWQASTKAMYRGMAYAAYKIGERGVFKKWFPKATNKPQAWLADKARHGADPASLVSGALHRVVIAMNAPYQFIANTMSAVAVAGSLSPHNFARAMRQFTGIASAVSSRVFSLHNTGKAFALTKDELVQATDRWAKFAGMSNEEFNDVANVIAESGLIDAVSHNTMIQNTVGKNAELWLTRKLNTPTDKLGRVVERGREALGPVGELTRLRTWDRALFGTLSKIGFEAGEYNNQILTFLTLYNRDKALGVANIKHSGYVDDLIGRTANLTGNMVPEASFEYTRSMLKPMFQYFPFAHRMVLQSLPKRLGGDKYFTRNEKARMVLGQYLMFGSSATILTMGVKEGIERLLIERWESEGKDPAEIVTWWRGDGVQASLEGWLFDNMADKVVTALWGEEGEEPYDYNWSARLAPGNTAKFIGGQLDEMASADLYDVFGVSMAGRYGSNIMSYLSTVHHITMAQLRGQDDVPFNERAEFVLKKGLMTALPTYNKWLAVQWAKEHENYISKGGQRNEALETELDRYLFLTFGINSEDRDSFLRARDEFEDVTRPGSKGEDAAVQEIANRMWEDIVLKSTKLATETPDDDMYFEMLNNYLMERSALLSVVGGRNAAAINGILMDKLENAKSESATPAETAFVEKLTKKLEGFGEDGVKLGTRLKHYKFVEDEPERAVLVQEMLDSLLEGEPESNMTNIEEEAP